MCYGCLTAKGRSVCVHDCCASIAEELGVSTLVSDWCKVQSVFIYLSSLVLRVCFIELLLCAHVRGGIRLGLGLWCDARHCTCTDGYSVVYIQVATCSQYSVYFYVQIN